MLVLASDPLSRMAIVGHLDAQPRIEVVAVEQQQRAGLDVIVFVADRVNVEALGRLRRMKAILSAPVVLVTGEIGSADVFTVVESNVVAVLPRQTITGPQIEEAVLTAAAGGGMLPSAMLGELLKQVKRLQHEVLLPHGLHASGLNAREIEVLRLMSDGLDTAEIAVKLGYSERLVKRVISTVTSRLGLHNRPHAVAYALRKGVI
ncbi:two component LuxR family transcriptional regulator [Actinoalloteichus hymeniacidonis]|uniref:Two component LuxR family transcriptional regulator n=1 Tax=Actinoalloteichus hymeniacidonis TaxID=340345 RepID=A0AAC9HRY4_9PSEU|nr:two component LuxR family transcriptional regulator [Actinoalloteichus hymeniacidonis]